MFKAQNDSLTNIYNGATCKKLINEHLEHSAEETPGALFVMDIDLSLIHILQKYSGK